MPTIHEAAKPIMEKRLKGRIKTSQMEESGSLVDCSHMEDHTINESGIQPLEYKVLVKLDPPEEVSKGGIVVTTGEETEREAMAQIKGTVVAIGHSAFCDWKPGGQPRIGDRVMISKHEGIICRGAEQGPRERPNYRLVADKQLAAILTRE